MKFSGKEKAQYVQIKRRKGLKAALSTLLKHKLLNQLLSSTSSINMSSSVEKRLENKI
jgi:hypothetical protein